jgi:hypothetical protein
MSKHCFFTTFSFEGGGVVVVKSFKSLLYGCSHKKEKYRKASAESQDMATDFVRDNSCLFHPWWGVLGINGCEEGSWEGNGYNPILNL